MAVEDNLGLGDTLVVVVAAAVVVEEDILVVVEDILAGEDILDTQPGAGHRTEADSRPAVAEDIRGWPQGAGPGRILAAGAGPGSQRRGCILRAWACMAGGTAWASWAVRGRAEDQELLQVI